MIESIHKVVGALNEGMDPWIHGRMDGWLTGLDAQLVMETIKIEEEKVRSLST